MTTAWRYFLVRPVRDPRTQGTHHGSYFYAPDFEDAMAQARAAWPRDKAWECITSGDQPPDWITGEKKRPELTASVGERLKEKGQSPSHPGNSEQ